MSNYKNKEEKHVKKSGCKLVKYTPKSPTLPNGSKNPNYGSEMKIWNAWRIADGSLQKITARLTAKSFLGDQAKGYVGSIAVEIINTNTASKEFYWGVMEISTDKVRIPDLNWVLNPKAPNGGYCGKSGKPKK